MDKKQFLFTVFCICSMFVPENKYFKIFKTKIIMTRKTCQRSFLSLLLVCCMLFLATMEIVAQNTFYSGKVVDATTNEPLIGVSILEKVL